MRAFTRRVSRKQLFTAVLLGAAIVASAEASNLKDFLKGVKDKAVEAAQTAAGQKQPVTPAEPATDPAAPATDPATPATPTSQPAPSSEPLSSTSGPMTKKPAAGAAASTAGGQGGSVKGSRVLTAKLKPDHINSVRSGGSGGAITLTASPDGKHIALIRATATRYKVELDGVLSQEWDDIGHFSDDRESQSAGRLLWSPDSSKLAYIARDGQKLLLVMGDQQIPINAQDFNRAGSLLFSSANRYAMLVRKRGEAAWVVVDGVTHGPYGDVRELQFSKDGKHVAWLIQKNAYANNAGGIQYVLDGKPLPMHPAAGGFRMSNDASRHVYHFNEFDSNNLSTGVRLVTDGKAGTTRYGSVTQLQISGDGKTIAYVATPTVDGVNASGEPRVVINGKPGKPYMSIDDLTLSPDGTRHAYVAKILVPGSSTMRGIYVTDGKETKDYDNVKAERTVNFTPDSRHVIFDNLNYVIVDGKEYPGPGQGQGGTVRVGASGSTFAYATKEDDNIVRVFVNGKQGPDLADANLDELAFTPDGSGAAYMAMNVSGRPVMVTGTQTYDMPDNNLTGFVSQDSRIRTILWSPDGKRWATTVKGKAVVDGQVRGDCNRGWLPTFSADSRHLAFACPMWKQGSSQEVFGIWLNDKLVKEVDAVFKNVPATFQFQSDGTLNVLAVVGTELQALNIAPN